MRTSVADVGTPAVETKLMQNYRIASAVQGGSEVAAIRNADGDVEMFSVGSDGNVWNFYPDPSSESGYSGVPVGAQAGAVAAGIANGRVVLFLAFGADLRYVVEDPAGEKRWGPPKSVAVPQPPGATRIARVVVGEIDARLYVAALTEYKSTLGTQYSLAVSEWDASAPAFTKTPMNLTEARGVWLGSSADNAAFAGITRAFVSYVVSTGTVTHQSVSGTFRTVSVDAAADSAGNDQVFAVLDDGNVYSLVGGGARPYSWSQLSRQMTFRQVEAVADASGAVHALAVSGDDRLYHLAPTAQSPTGYSSPPSPIQADVMSIGVARDDEGDFDVFAIGVAHNTLSHVVREEQTGNWVSQRVEVPSDGKVEEYRSYTSSVTFYDAAGALIVSSPATVWTTEQARITVNGSVYFVGPQHPARVSTNGGGVLTIAQESASLAVPTVEVNLTDKMTPGTSLTIEQYARIQSRLEEITGPDLMAAKAGDRHLIPDEYRKPETADALAEACRKCMELADTPPHLEYAFPRIGRAQGTWFRDTGGEARRRISADAGGHWQLSFDGSGLSFRALTYEEAAALIEAKQATLPQGLFEWLEDVGDFFAGVAEGIVEVVETIVTTIADGVKAVYTFVVDGVTYWLDVVVEFVEQAFDVVESFFAQVKVFFEDLFEWLGFLFDWPDILRTHKALAYSMDQFLGFLEGAAAGIQSWFDNGMDAFQNQISDLFDEAIRDIAGSSTVGGYDRANDQQSGEFTSAVSNNIVFDGVIDNAGAAASTGLELQLGDDDLAALMQKMDDLETTTTATPAFGSASGYFTDVGQSPDELFSQLLATLFRVVEAVIQAILDGVQAVVDAMLQLMGKLVGILRSIFTQEWDIPFVSDFYSWVTDGSKLSMADLISLILAIPVTVLYKVIHGRAPFPDQASVDAFEASFDSQTMLRASGLAPVAAGESNDAAAQLAASPAGDLLAVGGAVCTFFFGGVSAINDGLPKAPTVLSKATFALETGMQVCSFPWFTSSGWADCNTPDGAVKAMWVYTCVGFGIDALWLGLDGRIPESANDVGVVIAHIYGNIHLAFAIMASAGQSGLVVAANIIPVIPEMAKILRFSGIVEATSGISLAVLAAVDGLFYTTGAVLGFLVATKSEDAIPALAH